MQFIAVRINADSRTEDRYSEFPEVDFYKNVWENSPQNGFHECVNFKNFDGKIKGYLPPSGHSLIPLEPFGIIFVTAKTKTPKELRDKIIGIQVNCLKLPDKVERNDVPLALKEYLGKKNKLTYHYTAPSQQALLFSKSIDGGSELLQPSRDRRDIAWKRISIQPILEKNLPNIFAKIKKSLTPRELKKWEELMKLSGNLPCKEDLDAAFNKEVSKILKQGKSKPICLKGNSHPAKKSATVTTFERSPSVVAATLLRANGKCECCEKPAPFNRKSDDTPYLEVHHKVPLADGGPDILENTEALCPNCHRRRHFG